jgi:glycosyltransferase involved in cell wall biosynthesis
MFKLAYCGIPHTGGTYTVYKRLREGLVKRDIEVRWVCIQPPDFVLESQFESELSHGEIIPRLDSDQENTANFIEHIESNYDGIIFNVLAGVLEANAARYLSNNLIKLELVHNITIGTYSFATAIKDYVHATIGVSPRITDDLIRTKKFDPNKTLTIPNATNLQSFADLPSLNHSLPLKLIYLGRVEEDSKGILWLPDIINETIKLGIQCTLNIAGSGPDLDKLKENTYKLGLDNYINFLGNIEYGKVPSILAQHHGFLMTSRYEGLPLSLVETMSAGCVPIFSKIRGVTDFIITEGENGYLFPIGDCRKAAQQIQKLQDEEVWRKLSYNARASIKSRFTIEQQAQAYADLINKLRENPTVINQPLSLDNFNISSSFKTGFRTYLPVPIKNFLRTLKEKVTSTYS